MEQKKDELKVYKFEITSLKKNEDGTISSERNTPSCVYAFEGDASPRIDYNRYWEFGNGCLNLVSKDNYTIDPDICNTIEWVNGEGFHGIDIRKIINGLEAPGRWAEVCLGNAMKTKLRVTRLKELPEIDPEATIRDSDLTMAQKHRVKIDGVSLFPEGGTVNASSPNNPTLVLRPNLKCELGTVWEEFIRARSGASVHVTVDTAYNSESNGEAVKMTIKAPSREMLDNALCAVGVLRPQSIEPDVVYGEGDVLVGFTATVILTTDI